MCQRHKTAVLTLNCGTMSDQVSIHLAVDDDAVGRWHVIALIGGRVVRGPCPLHVGVESRECRGWFGRGSWGVRDVVAFFWNRGVVDFSTASCCPAGGWRWIHAFLVSLQWNKREFSFKTYEECWKIMKFTFIQLS